MSLKFLAYIISDDCTAYGLSIGECPVSCSEARGIDGIKFIKGVELSNMKEFAE